MALWLQVGTIWPTLLFFPIVSLIWAHSGSIIELFGVGESNPRVISLANEFGRWSILWLWPSIAFTSLSIWLETMEIVWPATILSIVFIGVNFGLNQVFIHGVGSWEGLGYIGSPIATGVSKTGQLVILWFYCFHIRKYQHDFSKFLLVQRNRLKCSFLLRHMATVEPGVLEAEVPASLL